jgi:hypothetical protein
MNSWTSPQSQIEFMQAFSELNRLPRREPNGFKLSPYKKTAQNLLKKDPVIGNTLLGLLACLEHDLPAMHEYHRRALDEGESCFSLIYYAVSLEKSCLWGEAARFGLLALDLEPANLKILEAIIKLAPLTGRFSLFKRLLPQWQAANGGIPHGCHIDQEIVSDLLARHGLQEKDLKEILAGVGSALSETNVVLQDFRYEIVTRRREAPFLHFRFAISDELAAASYEDAVDAKLAGVFSHPRLTDAFSFSIENAGMYRLFESMERELREHPDAVRVPDPQKMKAIEELVAGVVL